MYRWLFWSHCNGLGQGMLRSLVIESSELVGEVAFLYRAVTHAQERLDSMYVLGMMEE